MGGPVGVEVEGVGAGHVEVEGKAFKRPQEIF